MRRRNRGIRSKRKRARSLASKKRRSRSWRSSYGTWNSEAIGYDSFGLKFCGFLVPELLVPGNLLEDLLLLVGVADHEDEAPDEKAEEHAREGDGD